MFSWIRDLQCLFDFVGDKNNKCNSLVSVNYGYDQDNHIEGDEYDHQIQRPDTKPNEQNPSIENGILFISQVPRYIAQKKKEYRMLVENKQDLLK